MNIASALTGGLKEDIRIDQSTVNVGNFLMFLGIIILEIPSNITLIHVGPRIFLPAQILVFGLIATLQVLIHNRGGFLATRLILGICESGYIPGSLYVLSTWYKEAELARRISFFFAACLEALHLVQSWRQGFCVFMRQMDSQAGNGFS